MITLYTFGPDFGLSDPSPFVMKAQILLGMAGLAYQEDTTGFLKAPKGKLPYIKDNNQVVADSTFIRIHIEQKYGFDFDPGLTHEQRSLSWAIEKMGENHLYWLLASVRWMDDDNFVKIADSTFKAVPALIRPLIARLARRKVKQALWHQGTGRHAPAEFIELARRDIDALAAILGHKQYLMGDLACGADATITSLIAGLACPAFDTPIRTIIEGYPNLLAYKDRILEAYSVGTRRSRAEVGSGVREGDAGDRRVLSQ